MRILVVEDEHKIANSLKKGLVHEKYTVDLAFDGEEGLDFAQSEDYDLIILDRLLPKIDGIEICRKLRESKNHTPILMLTAKGQLEDKVFGLDTGADDYMVKPFAFAELFARVRALIRRPKKTEHTILIVENLSLNTVTFEVKRADRPIRLSNKEFSLLQYLMRHQNRIISKEQLISHVWNYDADVLENTVEVYIKHLRDKIDAPFPYPPLIQTIRGFGYKIGGK